MLKQHLLTLFGTGHVEELTVVVEAVLQAAKLCEAIAAERTDRAITKADASPVTSTTSLGSLNLLARSC